jgi:hypothetical protein
MAQLTGGTTPSGSTAGTAPDPIVPRSALSTSLDEPRWSYVETRMQVSARVEADRPCAAIRQRQKCPARSVRLLGSPLGKSCFIVAGVLGRWSPS